MPVTTPTKRISGRWRPARLPARRDIIDDMNDDETNDDDDETRVTAVAAPGDDGEPAADTADGPDPAAPAVADAAAGGNVRTVRHHMIMETRSSIVSADVQSTVDMSVRARAVRGAKRAITVGLDLGLIAAFCVLCYRSLTNAGDAVLNASYMYTLPAIVNVVTAAVLLMSDMTFLPIVYISWSKDGALAAILGDDDISDYTKMMLMRAMRSPVAYMLRRACLWLIVLTLVLYGFVPFR
jgi:hypothetical protein